MQKKHRFPNPQFYVDDGYTGTNFDRPDFIRMNEDCKKGLVRTVIVKDLSRFGREHIGVGRYQEIIYPENGIRFIAIMDNVEPRVRTAMNLPLSQIFLMNGIPRLPAKRCGRSSVPRR